MIEWGVDFLFSTVYTGLITMVALVAAIPYGIYVGSRKLWSKLRGGQRGHS
jgi:hypothetical protein